jgi:hypothetical protein
MNSIKFLENLDEATIHHLKKCGKSKKAKDTCGKSNTNL